MPFVYPRDNPDYQKEFYTLQKETWNLMEDARKKHCGDSWYIDNVAYPAICSDHHAKQDALQQRFGLPPMECQKKSN